MSLAAITRARPHHFRPGIFHIARSDAGTSGAVVTAVSNLFTAEASPRACPTFGERFEALSERLAPEIYVVRVGSAVTKRNLFHREPSISVKPRGSSPTLQ